MRVVDPARDLRPFWEHLVRHGKESGQEGDLIYHPYEKPWSSPFDEFKEIAKKRWSKSLSEPGWERSWIIENEFGEILGHLTLRNSPAMETTLHRAMLMMGLERPIRRQGLGSRFLDVALAWANAETSLDWIDLGVFAHNKPALALYQKFGFREVGRVRDAFRIHGQSIEDVTMTLKLGDRRRYSSSSHSRDQNE